MTRQIERVGPAQPAAIIELDPERFGYSDIEMFKPINQIYLMPANFVASPFGTFGELARNAFHGPGVNNFDLGLLKNIRLRARLAVQLRGEFFNAFNHAQFAFAGITLATSIAAGKTLPVIS
jgi:hypothetical protein